jgi:hypothetical protein
MTTDQLREEIHLELASLRIVVSEIASLLKDYPSPIIPSLRDISAATSFMTQFYNGLENIMKRIVKYHTIPLPKGEDWHRALAEMFFQFPGSTPHPPLPILFEGETAFRVKEYRKFRHVAMHGYSFGMDWLRIYDLTQTVPPTFRIIEGRILEFLEQLAENSSDSL